MKFEFEDEDSNEYLTGDDPCRRKHGGNPESEAAWDSMAECSVGAVRSYTLNAIRASFIDGLTEDELQAKCGLRHQTLSPRFTELKKMKLIRKIGKRETRTGRMAGIFISTDDKTEAALAEHDARCKKELDEIVEKMNTPTVVQ